MNKNKAKVFLKSLSNEIDSLVSKIGVIKIAIVVIALLILNYLIGTYFENYIYTYCITVILVMGLLITSLKDNSKIRFVAVWVSSFLAVFTIIVLFFVLVFGVGESIINTIYSWFT